MLSERKAIMNGKNRCRILKDIRKKIALENDIEYVTTECKYKGDCLGTCPKCESEVRYLEAELAKKRSLGQKIALAGIAAGITLTSTGCGNDIFSGLGGGVKGDVPVESSEETLVESSRPDQSVVSEIVDGEIVEVIGEMPETSDTMGAEPELMGEPSYEESATAGILEPEPPEIVDPYLDIMGDMEFFNVDINDVARMNNEDAKQTIDGWTREFIDYHWQEYIYARTFDFTQYATAYSLVELWFDQSGNITNLFIYEVEEPELMGDMPVEGQPCD